MYSFVPFVNVGNPKTVPWFNQNLKCLRAIKQRRWKKYLQSKILSLMLNIKNRQSVSSQNLSRQNVVMRNHCSQITIQAVNSMDMLRTKRVLKTPYLA